MSSVVDAADMVTAAEISRKFGLWQDKAMSAPVLVTHRGRPRVVLMSAETYYSKALGLDRQSSEISSDAQLGIVADQMIEGFVTLDRDLNYLSINPAAAAYYGRPREQMIGRCLTSVYPETVGSPMLDYYQWVLRSGEVVNFESMSAKFGDRRISVRVFPYGEGIGVLFCNVTELHGLRRSVAELQAFRRALDQLPAVCRINLNVRGVVTACCEDFEAMSGFKASEVVGRRLSDFIHPRHRGELIAAVDAAFAGGEPAGLDLVLLSRDQTCTPLSIGLAPVTRDLVPDELVVILTERHGAG